MQCPVCDERLREVDRFGVQVDICPSCRGVWLDRGELDKILQLASQGDPYPMQGSDRPEPRRGSLGGHEFRDRRHDEGHHGHDGRERGRSDAPSHRRRGSWLGDILGSLGEGGD